METTRDNANKISDKFDEIIWALEDGDDILDIFAPSGLEAWAWAELKRQACSYFSKLSAPYKP